MSSPVAHYSLYEIRGGDGLVSEVEGGGRLEWPR